MNRNTCRHCRRSMRAWALDWRVRRGHWQRSNARLASVCLRLAISYRDGCDHVPTKP
jgi:hypothetical protein